MNVTILPSHCLQAPLNRYVRLVAHAIREPQEIWYEWTSNPIPKIATVFVLECAGLVRRHLSRYKENDEVIALTVITTIGNDGWEIRDVVVGEDAMAAARCGNLAYREGPR